MTSTMAFAKINLALVVGPLRQDGRHELATVLQRIDLCDVVQIEPTPDPGIEVDGFEEDTLVRAALQALAEASGTRPRWHVSIEKRIPVAAGLGGGSSDAAAALELANALLADPLPSHVLRGIAARVGTDVPFFLGGSPMLGIGDGAALVPLTLPQDYVVLLVLPAGERKESTEAVYRDFDGRQGAEGFEERRSMLLEALAGVEGATDLSALARNDLVSSVLAEKLEGQGAFRADVSGAGPTVYGLFEHEADATRAAHELGAATETWITRPRAAR